MPDLYASWIHGHSVVVENPPSDPGLLSVTHFGWGTVARIRPGKSFWFHIPIPTPVIDKNQRLKLIKFFLLHKISQHGALEFVHLWDGSRKVASRFRNKHSGASDLIRTWGDHLGIDAVSTFELETPAVAGTGFGISFNVTAFEHDGGEFIPFDHPAELMVAAAGGDFWPS